MPLFHQKRLKIEAYQWTGDNVAELEAFTDGWFAVLDEQARANSDDPDATAEVYDTVHGTWQLLYIGDWVLRGIRGDFYRVAKDAFQEQFERVPPPP